MKKVAVLFTGGKDSSLVACRAAKSYDEVHLLTANSGIGIGSNLTDIRVSELREAFPETTFIHKRIPTAALFREISIKNIEDDFDKWKVNLVLLGEKLAIHTVATQYCIENDISVMMDGSAKYQNDLAEQKMIAINLLTEFEQEHGIAFKTPIYDIKDGETVKYELLKMGVTNKSLESVSIFGDSFSEPSDTMVNEYIKDKLPLCKKYLSDMDKLRVS